MRTEAGAVAVLVGFTTLFPAAPATSEWYGYRTCDEARRDRPAILAVWLDGRGDNSRPWSFDDAKRAFRAARADDTVLLRQGREFWDGAAPTWGTVGQMRRVRARFRNVEVPEGKAKPFFSFFCAGHRDNQKRFLINIPVETDIEDVIRRNGNKERYCCRLRFDDTRWYKLRPRNPERMIHRAIHYLKDRAVLYAEPEPPPAEPY